MQRVYPKSQILVGIPTSGMAPYFFMQSIMGMSMPSNFSQTLRMVQGREVGEARSIIAQEAINIGAEYLLFLDEDMIFPGNLLQKLLYHLQTKPDWTAVTALYSTKGVPSEPLVYTEPGQGPHYGWKYGEVIQVLFTGLGATLIRVKDIEHAFDDKPLIEERNPWNGAPMQVRQRFFTGQEEIRSEVGIEKMSWTEDSYFYAHLKDKGYKCFVDTSLVCHHYEKSTNTFYTPPNDNGCAVKPDPWTHEPRIVNLGAGGERNPYELNVDLRDGPGLFRCDIRALPDDWADQFDVAKAHHVLEHFGFEETETVLKEWHRIIKPGGTIEISVPDMETIAQGILDGRMDTWVQGAIFGDQGHPFWRQPAYGGEDENGRFLSHSYQHNHHKAGFTAASLNAILTKVGFVDCNAVRDLNLGAVTVTARKE